MMNVGYVWTSSGSAWSKDFLCIRSRPTTCGMKLSPLLIDAPSICARQTLCTWRMQRF